MANATDSIARAVHGMNPQRLINAVVLERVYNTLYWKKECFALNAALVVDRAVELNYIAGTYNERVMNKRFRQMESEISVKICFAALLTQKPI